MTISILETLTCLETESLASAIKKMSDKESKYIKGVIAVVNKKGTLVGSFVDGDLRRIINEKKDLEILFLLIEMILKATMAIRLFLS